MIRSPAKTNPFIEVPLKRADGFHELDALFCELELADELELEPTADGAIALEVDAPGIPCDDRNLVWRAVAALREHAGRPELGARVRLRKRIPAEGGLGGGSSNAAVTLRALDALWELATPPEELARIAGELGSDVPFFLGGGFQRGRGRGELLTPQPPPARPLELVLVFPGVSCPTPRVYGALAPHLGGPLHDPAELIAAIAAGDPARVGPLLFNRLEAAAFALYPRLGELKARLAARPEVLGVLLSGSGSTLVCLSEDAAGAAALATALQAEGLRALTTRTVA